MTAVTLMVGVGVLVVLVALAVVAIDVRDQRRAKAAARKWTARTPTEKDWDA